MSNDPKRWIVVCQSTEIGMEAARGCVVEGRQLVVWRDVEAEVHVWDDYCPHRGAQLSRGLVSGGLISCPEHGWRFDTNGQMVRLLASATPGRVAIHACVYAAREAEGLVWVCFSRSKPGSGMSGLGEVTPSDIGH
jgi:phenylpropionate dioxygenase-like ring-hydroxylating dioxygenase large terminal subunit